MPIIETGHAKNVANFEDLISYVTSLGVTYNPTKTALKLATLSSQFTSAKSEILSVTSKTVAFNNATNARILAFAPIRALSTRLVNALAITDVSAELLKDAKAVNRKLQGSRATKTETQVDPNAPAPNTISASQQSYDQLVEHFNRLIEVLKSEPSYAPNESDLKVTALTSTLAALKTANSNLTNAYTNVVNARIARDKILYKDKVGLVPVALDVKAYIKSLYGSTSPEFKHVNKMSFKIIK